MIFRIKTCIAIGTFLLMCAVLHAPLTAQTRPTAQQIDSSMRAIFSLPNDTVKIEKMGKMGSRLRNSHPVQGGQLLDSALRLATHLKKPYYQGMVHNELALNAMLQAKSDSALWHYQQAMAAFELAQNEKGLGKCYTNLGSYYMDRADWKTALDYYQKAAEIKERQKDANLSIVLQNIGMLFHQLSQQEKALEYLHRAEKMQEAKSDSFHVMTTYLNLGEVYHTQENNQEATGYYLKAIQIARALNDVDRLSYAYYGISKVYLRKEEYRKAIEYVQKAQQLSEELGMKQRTIRIINQTGRIYIAQKQYKLAEPLLRRNLDQARLCDVPSDMMESLEMLIVVEKKLHNRKKMDEYEQEFNALKLKFEDGATPKVMERIEQQHAPK